MIQVGQAKWDDIKINGTLDINVQKPLGQQGTGRARSAGLTGGV